MCRPLSQPAGHLSPAHFSLPFRFNDKTLMFPSQRQTLAFWCVVLVCVFFTPVLHTVLGSLLAMLSDLASWGSALGHAGRSVSVSALQPPVAFLLARRVGASSAAFLGPLGVHPVPGVGPGALCEVLSTVVPPSSLRPCGARGWPRTSCWPDVCSSPVDCFPGPRGF